jgi:phosphatidate phosphatase APP1
MLKFVFAVFFFILYFGHISSAKTIFISDIDDTIKRSHVLDRSDSIFIARRIDYAFTGMSTLYNLTKPDSLFYISNAPVKLMGKSHSEFLKYNLFPAGKLFLRMGFEDNFKESTITDLINTEKPDTVLLVGDNGEEDTLIYNAIVEKFKLSPIRFFTFIRENYPTQVHTTNEVGRKLEDGQIGFITAGELAVQMSVQKLLTKENALKAIYSTLNPEKEIALEEVDREIFLPYWLACSFHKLEKLPSLFQQEELAQKLWQKTIHRCREN